VTEEAIEKAEHTAGESSFIKVFEKADRVLERISYYAIYIAGIITLLMACATTFGVVMRYIFRRPEHFTYEISIFCLISSVTLSLAYIQRHGRNLRADYFSNRLSPKGQNIMINIIIPLVALPYILPLIWKSIEAAVYSLSIGERTYSAWAPPVGPIKLMVPIGATLLSLILIAQIIQGIVNIIKNSYEKTET
jgi:TRAP-type C4-dicarboxylate transport system permease small subunit